MTVIQSLVPGIQEMLPINEGERMPDTLSGNASGATDLGIAFLIVP